MRSKYLLMVSPEKWTPSQKERAEILFELYPDIKTAYSMTNSLRMIFAQRCDREAGRESIKKWYLKVGEFDNKAFWVTSLLPCTTEKMKSSITL